MDESVINDDNIGAWPKVHRECGMLLARSVGKRRRGNVPKKWTKLLCRLHAHNLEFYGYEAAKTPLDSTTVTVVSVETLAPHPTIVVADDFELRVSPFVLEEFWAWFLSLRCGGGTNIEWDQATATSNELVAALAARRVARGVTVRDVPLPLYPRIHTSSGWIFLEDDCGTPNLVIAIDSMDAMRFDGDAASLLEIGTDVCIACLDDRLGITATMLERKRLNQSSKSAKYSMPFETLPILSSSPAGALEAAVLAAARQLVLCHEGHALTCGVPTRAAQFSVEKELREQVADFLNHKYVVNKSDGAFHEGDDSDEDSTVARRQIRLCSSWQTPRDIQAGFRRDKTHCPCSDQGAESKEVQDDDDAAYGEARELLASRRVAEAHAKEVDANNLETEFDKISQRSHEILGLILDACAPNYDISDAILLFPSISPSKEATVSTQTSAATTRADPISTNKMGDDALLIPSRVCVSEVSDDFVNRDMTSHAEPSCADRWPVYNDSHEAAIALLKPMHANGAGSAGRVLKAVNSEKDESENQYNAVDVASIWPGELRTADDKVDASSIADLAYLFCELADRPAVASAIGSTLHPSHRRRYVASLMRGILSRYSCPSSKLGSFIAAIDSRVSTKASVSDGPLPPPWPREYLYDALVEVARGEDVVAFSILIAEKANVLPQRRLITMQGLAPAFVKCAMNDSAEDSTPPQAKVNLNHLGKTGTIHERRSSRRRNVIQDSSAHDAEEAVDEDSDYTSVEEEGDDAEVSHLFSDSSGEDDLSSHTANFVDGSVLARANALTNTGAARKRAGNTSEVNKSESYGLMPDDDCEYEAYALAMAVVEAACKTPIPKSVSAVWQALSTSSISARAFLIESTLVAALQVRVRHLGGAGSGKLGAGPERPPTALQASQSQIPASRFPARARRAVELLREVGRCALWSPLGVRLECLRGFKSLSKSMAAFGYQDRDDASQDHKTQREDHYPLQTHASGDDDVVEKRSEYLVKQSNGIATSTERSPRGAVTGNERVFKSACISTIESAKVNSELERRTRLTLLADSIDAFENRVAGVSLCQVEPQRRRFVMRRSEIVDVIDATANYAMSRHSVSTDASIEGNKQITAFAHKHSRQHRARRVVLVDNEGVQGDACLSETAFRAATRLVSTFRSALILSAQRDARDSALIISCPQAASGDVAVTSDPPMSNPVAGQVAWLSRALADAIDRRQRGVRALCRRLLDFVQIAEARTVRRDAMKIELSAARAKLSVLEQHAHLSSARTAVALRNRLVHLLGKEAAIGLSYKIDERAQSNMFEARHGRALMRTVFSPLNLTHLGADVVQVCKESHKPDDTHGLAVAREEGIVASQTGIPTHKLAAANARPSLAAPSIESCGQPSPKFSANDQCAEHRLSVRSLLAP